MEYGDRAQYVPWLVLSIEDEFILFSTVQRVLRRELKHSGIDVEWNHASTRYSHRENTSLTMAHIITHASTLQIWGSISLRVYYFQGNIVCMYSFKGIIFQIFYFYVYFFPKCVYLRLSLSFVTSDFSCFTKENMFYQSSIIPLFIIQDIKVLGNQTKEYIVDM
jgi:hypothetical protein